MSPQPLIPPVPRHTHARYGDTAEREAADAARVGVRLWRRPWVRRLLTAGAGASAAAFTPSVVHTARVAATHDAVDSVQQVAIDRAARRLDSLEGRAAAQERAALVRFTGLGRAACLTMTEDQRRASGIPCPRLTSGEDWTVDLPPLTP